MKIILSIILLLPGLAVYGQPFMPSEVTQVVSRLEKGQKFAFAPYTGWGYQSEPYFTYTELKDKATAEELLYLTNHAHPVVRSYAFLALKDLQFPKLFSILLSHLTDNELIEIESEIGEPPSLTGDVFLTLTQQEDTQDVFTSQQRVVIDSVLLFDPAVRLAAKTKLLTSLSPDSKYYSRIRQIVQQEKHTYAAVVAIAKYQKADDRRAIQQLLTIPNDTAQHYGLWAVSIFPDSSFFPVLGKIHQQEMKRANVTQVSRLYEAIVQYKTEEARKLIMQAVQNTDSYIARYHSIFIWKALQKHPDQYFSDLAGKLKLTEEDKEFFTQLFK